MRLTLPSSLRRLLGLDRTASALDARAAGGEAVLAPQESQPDGRWLQAIVDASDDGLLAAGPDGRLRLVNPSAAALLETEAFLEADGREWPGRLLRLREAAERAMQDGYARIDWTVERGGRSLTLEGRANPTYSEHGSVDGAVIVLCDVTRSRELVAGRADDWATLAHDLKTPLNSIGGFTTLLLQEAVGPLNPLQRDFLRTIEQEGQRLLRAVQDFLEVARDGSSPDAPRLDQLHLRLVIEDVVERVRSLAVRKSIDIRIVAAADLPTVEADCERIALVLLNLLDNAMSFSPEGATVVIDGRQIGDTLEISVADQGVGIPPDSMGRVFGRYYRAPNQPPGGRPGAGLGLAICKQVVEQHGGRIWAENGADGGTRLVFTLPIVYRQAPLEALGAAW